MAQLSTETLEIGLFTAALFLLIISQSNLLSAIVFYRRHQGRWLSKDAGLVTQGDKLSRWNEIRMNFNSMGERVYRSTVGVALSSAIILVILGRSTYDDLVLGVSLGLIIFGIALFVVSIFAMRSMKSQILDRHGKLKGFEDDRS